MTHNSTIEKNELESQTDNVNLPFHQLSRPSTMIEVVDVADHFAIKAKEQSKG